MLGYLQSFVAYYGMILTYICLALAMYVFVRPECKGTQHNIDLFESLCSFLVVAVQPGT